MDSKSKNRQLMPETAKVVDYFRTVFPKIKVIYAEEGDYRIGKKPDPSKYVVPCFSEPVKPKKGKKK
jgi:hypothetical protein